MRSARLPAGRWSAQRQAPGLGGADAGLLVPPGNVEALAGALARVIGDARLRARLADGAKKVRIWLRSWDQAVEEMIAALKRLDSNG
jgi:glycosyltransferase involved in cell wall biosynthesis